MDKQFGHFDVVDIVIISILVAIFAICLFALSIYMTTMQYQQKMIDKRIDKVNHLHTIEGALRKLLPSSVKLPSDIEKEQDEKDLVDLEKERKEKEIPDNVPDIILREPSTHPTHPNPPIQMVPINIPTRGVDEFQQVGIISSIDKSSIDNSSKDTRKKILPLYGRRTYNRSSKWNYYTSTDGYHVIQLSVVHKNKDCMDNYGCDELYTDDEIYIQEYEESFRVSIYKRSPIRYIPYV